MTTKPLQPAKTLIWNLIAGGLPTDHDIDVIRKFVLLNLIILVGSFFLVLLSVIAGLEGDHMLAVIDLSLALFLILLLLVLRRKRNYRFIGMLGSLIFGCFYLFLILYGDVNNAKYLWVLTYPIIVLLLLGRKTGTFLSLSLLCLSTAAIYWIIHHGDSGQYNATFLIRFFSTYVTVFLFSFVAEIIHETVYHKLTTSKNALQASYRQIQENSLQLSATNQRLVAEIEERKRIERALKNSESFLDDVIESIQDGICVLNPDLTIRHTNRVMQKWYQPNAPLIGKKCYACFHNRKKPCPTCPTLRCMVSGKTEREVVAGLSGSPVEWIELFSFPILDKESGKITGAVEFSRDITVPKRLERQLSRAQKMEAVGTLAGGVAHDLNNILSGIVSYPELILMDLPQDSPLRVPIYTIQKSGQKAAAIVQDLLTLARRGVAVKDVVNLNEVVTGFLTSPECDNVKTYHPKVMLAVNLAPALSHIVGSPVHLQKTVMNLVSNAAEAMTEGGRLTIKTADRSVRRQINGFEKIPAGRYVVLSIADTGVGISPEDVQKIFEPFYTKKVMGRSGTGLGMTVVWGTVKDLDGYIDIQSTPHSGTTFDLYFPQTRQKQREEGERIPVEAYAGEEEILVVDDVPEQREIASAMLRKLGYSVRAVSSGEESIRYLSDHRVDLIVLDMVMDPGMDGLDTYKEISKRFPGHKAIIASGYSETDRVKGAHRLGVGAYIKKPYTLQSIGMAVRAELDKTGTLQTAC